MKINLGEGNIIEARFDSQGRLIWFFIYFSKKWRDIDHLVREFLGSSKKETQIEGIFWMSPKIKVKPLDLLKFAIIFEKNKEEVMK